MDAAKEKIEEVVNIILNHVDHVSKIFLFGSRAGQKNQSRSDIDIGIIAAKSIPYAVLEKLDEEIDDLETLYMFDIVDFTGRDDDFTKEALKSTETWYENE